MVQLKKPETISIIDNSYGQLKSFYLFVMVTPDQNYLYQYINSHTITFLIYSSSLGSSRRKIPKTSVLSYKISHNLIKETKHLLKNIYSQREFICQKTFVEWWSMPHLGTTELSRRIESFAQEFVNQEAKHRKVRFYCFLAPQLVQTMRHTLATAEQTSNNAPRVKTMRR